MTYQEKGDFEDFLYCKIDEKLSDLCNDIVCLKVIVVYYEVIDRQVVTDTGGNGAK